MQRINELIDKVKKIAFSNSLKISKKRKFTHLYSIIRVNLNKNFRVQAIQFNHFIKKIYKAMNGQLQDQIL